MRAPVLHARRGFTLLEVLVAIAILGLGLTVILSSQVGLFSSATRGQHLTVATGLVRCKMSEVEEKLLREGYPLIDQSEDGDCCGEDGDDAYRCSWKIERVELPQLQETLGDGGVPGGEDMSALGPLAALAQPGGDKAAGAGEATSPGELAEKLAGSGSSMAGMAPMLMGLVYPNLKPLLEASIRKLTVTAHWKEGTNERTLGVTQYVTNPQQGQLDPNAAAGMGEDGGIGGNPFGPLMNLPRSGEQGTGK